MTLYNTLNITVALTLSALVMMMLIMAVITPEML